MTDSADSNSPTPRVMNITTRTRELALFESSCDSDSDSANTI